MSKAKPAGIGNIAFDAGRNYECYRIIQLLKRNIGWIEALEYDYFADELADLITGKDPGREEEAE